jgi:hypothetical protein
MSPLKRTLMISLTPWTLLEVLLLWTLLSILLIVIVLSVVDCYSALRRLLLRITSWRRGTR